MSETHSSTQQVPGFGVSASPVESVAKAVEMDRNRTMISFFMGKGEQGRPVLTSPGLTGSADHIFVAAQFIQPHGATGV